MKQFFLRVLKFLLTFLIGMALSLCVGILIGAASSGKSVAEAFQQVFSSHSAITFALIGWFILWMAVSAVLQIILHEAGHLLMGLLTGYRFVSFRIFQFTLIRHDGHYRWKRFSLAGTGGQCLMSPPDKPIEQVDTRWYNAGGVLANLLTAALAIATLDLCALPQWLEVLLLSMAIMGIIYGLLNGIPLKISGIPNDGHNLFHLEKSPQAKFLLCRMLMANALIQEGTQPKDMPSPWFEPTQTGSWTDSMWANWQMMATARLLNLHRWEEAHALLADAMSQRDHLLKLFRLELSAEYVFVCLVTGRTHEAQNAYDPETEKYVRLYAATQSSKQRILMAVSLLLRNDAEHAAHILHDTQARRDQYLLQGEADMDIHLMEWLLHQPIPTQTISNSSEHEENPL
ncbi:MAG: hypothetical protein ILA34_07420 [Bacteroidaceae bacterium]|nr:hypothetical protein [Bacteroidaceae bacterium]